MRPQLLRHQACPASLTSAQGYRRVTALTDLAPGLRTLSRPLRPSRSDYSGVVADLADGDPRSLADRGDPDPAVTAALAAFAAGTGSEHGALSALAGSRLLVPVVAIPADGCSADGHSADGHSADGHSADGHSADGHSAAGHSAAGGAEKTGEMALPSILGADGRPALPAFTCLESLRQWRPDARPVPASAASVWQSAVQESCAVIIDIAGPVPLAVEGARLAALATGAAVPLPHEDPDVQRAALEAVAEHAPGIRVALSPPVGGMDLTVELAPGAGEKEPVAGGAADQVASAIADRLGARLRRGIAVRLRPPAG
jgi:hypothetical protein